MELQLKVTRTFEKHVLESKYMRSPFAWVWEVPVGLTILVIEASIEFVVKVVRSIVK